MTPSYQKLKMTPLEKCDRAISPVSRGNLANEYGDRIEDYSKVKSPLTNRLISPYVTSETHGANVFDWLVKYINEKFEYGSKVLDLGCGAGELISKLKDNYVVFGTTIHIGEVRYGREIYDLADICPIDMRDCDIYFSKEFFDCIIAHCSLHFITPHERDVVCNWISFNLLKKGGKLIIVDYKGNKGTGLEYVGHEWIDITPENYETMGTLTVLQK